MELERIIELEKTARRLEPSKNERAALTEKVFRYADAFLDKIHESPAYVTTDDPGSGLSRSPIIEDPITLDSALELVGRHVDHPGLNPASGGHLGYIPGGGIFPAALGDFLADVTNRFAGLFYASPGAVRLEHVLIRWMTDLVGYPPTAGGDLTSGGSVANLAAIVTARDAHDVKPKDFDRTVVYVTRQVHHSVDKALRIAGLKECVKRYVPTDERHRMDAGRLDRAIAKDEKSGLRPWLVIASAGTTDTGAVDPLEAIAATARKKGMWFHVDAAYGGFFILCGEGKTILKGIDESDSLVIDPHKGLFLPYGTGAVLVRDRARLYEAHYYRARYMQDARAPSDEYSPADHSPELTKHFRGLRLWLPLKLFGLAPFRACLEEKLLLARYFHEEIRRSAGFEAGPEPDLSVVTFRYAPKRGPANEFNERLLAEVRRDGRVFLSSTTLDGKFTLRLAVLNFRTHLDTIDRALEILKEKAKALEEKAS